MKRVVECKALMQLTNVEKGLSISSRACEAEACAAWIRGSPPPKMILLYSIEGLSNREPVRIS